MYWIVALTNELGYAIEKMLSHQFSSNTLPKEGVFAEQCFTGSYQPAFQLTGPYHSLFQNAFG